MCYISGWILIDRCGKHFGLILNFLRDGLVPLPDNCKEMAELLAEAKYYCISELAGACEQALLKKEREAEPICRVPLITSQKEEQLLINSTTKVIKFLLTYFFLNLKILLQFYRFYFLNPPSAIPHDCALLNRTVRAKRMILRI